MLNQQEINKFVSANLKNVTHYLEIPSVSAQHRGIDETVAWISDQFTNLGAARVEQWTDQGGNPVVFAEFSGNSDNTVLFYNHYDVQPPEPLDEWKSEPFSPTERDGKLFARGVCDDKGELMSRLTMLRYFKENGGLPVNMKFFVEGEEELGSPHVDNYVEAHQADLQADECIWEGGGKDEDEKFQITCGLKGIVSFDLHVKTADADIHSSLASYADNAVWRLVNALASLKDGNRVKVDGFYDSVKQLTQTEEEAVDKLNFNEEQVKQGYGLKVPFVTDDPKHDLINGSTMTINGISGGYEGEGVKTIVPKEASAKLDCRLVPNQDPKEVFDLVKKQLVKNGFEDIEARYIIGERGFRTSLDDPFVKLNHKVALEVYGDEGVSLVPNMPGGGPAPAFAETLNVPIVMVGIHYSGSHPHSPNENIRINDYLDGTYFLINLLNDLGNE